MVRPKEGGVGPLFVDRRTQPIGTVTENIMISYNVLTRPARQIPEGKNLTRVIKNSDTFAEKSKSHTPEKRVNLMTVMKILGLSGKASRRDEYNAREVKSVDLRFHRPVG